MKFKVGDKVEAPYGQGTIIEIRKGDHEPYLVYFRDYKGSTWVSENDLTLVETKSKLTIKADSITIGNIYTSISNLPEKYIINKGATILFWNDGTKTIVKKAKHDKYNKRLGFLTAYFQKTSGLSKSKANKYLDSLVDEDEYEREKKSN